MTEDRGDSFMDKVKDALGMGDRDDDVYTDDSDQQTAGAGVVVGGADADELGGDVNRPAGPDFGADERTGPELGIGLDEEGTAGTGEYNTGTGLGYDYDRNAVTDPGPLETEPTVGSTPAATGGLDESLTRGGAASGESPFEEEDADRRTF